MRIGVVVARYNRDYSEGLLRGCLEAISAAHGSAEVHWVPGAMELALTAKVLAGTGGFDALVLLGCIIKGETAHFEYVSAEAAAGATRVGLDCSIPCAFGVLTTYDSEQARARIAPGNNKGAEAAETAIEMAQLLKRIRS
jgi:6,7-dimethyl-8-ribityllumazine synthase